MTATTLPAEHHLTQAYKCNPFIVDDRNIQSCPYPLLLAIQHTTLIPANAHLLPVPWSEKAPPF